MRRVEVPRPLHRISDFALILHHHPQGDNMRRLVALLVVFAALVTTAACGSDGSTNAGPASVAGTYTLRTVNGSPLPYTLFEVGGDKYEITADAVTIKEGGAWTESGTIRSTESGTVTTSTVTNVGTYTRAGTVINFVSAQTGPFSGSVESGTLSLTQEGLVAVYTR
jgi:hypothetical protein